MESYTTLSPPADDARERIEAVLHDKGRVNVEHAFSLHNMVEVTSGVRLHLVLKFKYDESAIEAVFGATKPAKDVEKRYNEAFRLFPYCLFNSIDEVPLSWTYQNNGGRVYERVEVLVTLTDVRYMRHYPFELRLLNIKVGSDGTAKTGLVNLLPEVKKGTTTPNVDFGVFTKVGVKPGALRSVHARRCRLPCPAPIPHPVLHPHARPASYPGDERPADWQRPYW